MRRLSLLLAVLIVALTPCLAYADTVLGDANTYVDGEAALLAYFGESDVMQANLHYKSLQLRQDFKPNFETAVTCVEQRGNDYVYVGNQNILNAAKAEYDALYGGGGGGGGHAIDPPSGGGGDTGGEDKPLSIDWNELELTHKAGEVYGTGGWSPMESYTVKLHIDDSFKAQLNSELAGYKDWFVTLQHHNGNSTKFYLQFFMTKGDITNVYDSENPSSSKLGFLYCDYLGATGYREYALPNRWASSNDVQINHAAKTIDFYFRNDNDNYYNSSFSATPNKITNGNGFAWSLGSSEPAPAPEPDPTGGDDGGGDGPVIVPDPPESDPVQYITYEGDNTDIDVNVTINNDGGQTDLTPVTLRLDRIYDRQGEIGNDLLDFELSMRNEFYGLRAALDGLFSSYFGSLNQWLELIYSRVNDINRNIGNLDKSTDDITDLSGVQSYLMQILQTLQGMGTNSPASDPTDLTGVMRELDTIEDLLRGIKNPFTPVLPPVVIDDDNPIEKQVTDKGSELSRHFPCSIPWDVYGMLALFVAEPVAPQFDIPVFGMDEDIHVDLSGWDTVAAVSRSATFVLFALGLALRTKDMIWKD